MCRPTEHGHARRGPKLSVVCNLQRLRRRRHKLRLHNIPTMHGHRSGNGQLVPTQYAICSSTWTALIQPHAKSLSSLNCRGSSLLSNLVAGKTRRETHSGFLWNFGCERRACSKCTVVSAVFGFGRLATLRLCDLSTVSGGSPGQERVLHSKLHISALLATRSVALAKGNASPNFQPPNLLGLARDCRGFTLVPTLRSARAEATPSIPSVRWLLVLRPSLVVRPH
jgi:hypothetical protein